MSRLNMRKLIPSVTVFLKHQDKYLFIHRHSDRRVDADRLNGIGGKVEAGEDYLSAAIRETKEEAGLEVGVDQVRFAGMIHIEGGYAEDWMCAFFEIETDSFKLPMENECKEGKLVWLTVKEALNSDYELVDDLHHLLPRIQEKSELFFANAQLNSKEKIKEIQVESLKCS